MNVAITMNLFPVTYAKVHTGCTIHILPPGQFEWQNYSYSTKYIIFMCILKYDFLYDTKYGIIIIWDT